MLHQSHGRNKITYSLAHSLPTVAMVPPKGHHTFCRTPARREQSHSRSGIPYSTVLSGVDVEHSGVQQDQSSLWAMLSGPLRVTTKQSTQEGRQLATRPICHNGRCIPDDVEERARICISPIRSLGQMPPEDTPRRLHGDIGGTNLEHTAMVSDTAGANNRTTVDPAEIRVSSDRSIRSNTSSTEEGSTGASRLEGLRRLHLKGGVSKRVSDLMLAGWSKGTNSTYQSSWNKWNSWCVTRELDPFSTDVQFFLDFL